MQLYFNLASQKDQGLGNTLYFYGHIRYAIKCLTLIKETVYWLLNKYTIGTEHPFYIDIRKYIDCKCYGVFGPAKHLSW